MIPAKAWGVGHRTAQGFALTPLVQHAQIALLACHDTLIRLERCEVTGCGADGIDIAHGSLQLLGSRVGHNAGGGQLGVHGFEASLELRQGSEVDHNQCGGCHLSDESSLPPST